MNKQKRTMFFLLIALMVLLLGGCTANKGVSVYTLPLGDSGYISEIDFKTKDSYAYSYDTEGVVDGWVSYDYVEKNKTYSLSIELGKVNAGKTVLLQAGYYDENNQFVEYASTGNITLKEDEFATATVNFVATSDKDTVVKLVFGTNLDESVFKANNPEAKTSEINKKLKKLRGMR